MKTRRSLHLRIPMKIPSIEMRHRSKKRKNLIKMMGPNLGRTRGNLLL
jgi:hypothetical protein